MTPPDIAYSGVLMTAGIICIVAGLIVLQTRRNASGSIPLMILLFALSWWDLTYSLFWADVPGPYPNFWLYITYVGAVTVPAALMTFAMQLSEMDDWLKPPLVIGLCIEPLLVLMLLFTDPWHGLFFAGKQTKNIGVILAAGPVFWANVVYSYLLILIGMVVLVRRFIQASGIYKHQMGVVLVGAGIPWINSIIFVSGLSPFPNADNTPFSFTIAGLAFTYALLRYGLLDILPIARHVLIESMSDGVIVLDARNRLVDINPAAERVLGLSTIGKPVEDIFSAWPGVVEAFYEVKDIRAEVSIGKPSQSFLDLKISPLYDSRSNFIGRLMIWRDITPLRKAQMELQEQAIRDSLTGLYNRRYLNEMLERELARAERDEYPVSFVMIDIDHFKEINDSFGHSPGDAVLQRFGAQLMNQTRIGDIICRYGGEEFLVVLPNVTTEIVYQIAERWRRSFQEIQMTQEGKEIRSTISCGISEFPRDGKTGEELIASADKALYRAKATGRNRVVIWQTELNI
jgi:diguanylate cyclase (GGDEF)-like protein/PAS domain S-box-containing protein